MEQYIAEVIGGTASLEGSQKSCQSICCDSDRIFEKPLECHELAETPGD